MEHAKPKISELEMSPDALKESTDHVCRSVTLFQAQPLGCTPAQLWLRGGMQVYHGKCYFTVGSVHREQEFK